jgi:hypothetical protein
VILVNVFPVAEADIPALLKAWEADANWMKQQPGYISKQFSVLLLVALLAVGCGAATTTKDGWDYNGPDATLKSPPLNMSEERRREILEDLGGKSSGMPSEAIQEKFRAEFETWKRKYAEALQSARDACARSTGDSGTPGFWAGYSDAFVDCMRARGWMRPSGSNPL